MAIGIPRPARGQGEPQPFTHLGVPNADLYRSLLRTFARAKERFIVHLRPEDVAADLRIGADEQLIQALEQLVLWGNLRADADTSRVTTVEDFHRKRCLYQLTAAGQAAEQAIAFYEEAIGRRGQLQSVALADIADRLQSLRLLAADHDPDPAKVHLLLLSVAERFSSLADNCAGVHVRAPARDRLLGRGCRWLPGLQGTADRLHQQVHRGPCQLRSADRGTA